MFSIQGTQGSGCYGGLALVLGSLAYNTRRRWTLLVHNPDTDEHAPLHPATPCIIPISTCQPWLRPRKTTNGQSIQGLYALHSPYSFLSTLLSRSQVGVLSPDRADHAASQTTAGRPSIPKVEQAMQMRLRRGDSVPARMDPHGPQHC